MDIRAGYDGCWLQDYVPKVRADVVEIKELAPASDREGMAPTLTQSEAEPRPLDASGDGALQHARSDYTKHKVLNPTHYTLNPTPLTLNRSDCTKYKVWGSEVCVLMCTSVWMKACEYARGAQGRELAGAFLLCFCVCTFMCIDVWIDTHACIREAQRAGTLGGTRVLLAV